MIDIQAIFGGPARVAAVPEVVPQVQPDLPDDRDHGAVGNVGDHDADQHVGDGLPNADQDVGQFDVEADAALLAPCLWWIRRPDSRGRMGWQNPEVPEVAPFDDLDLPGAGCPVCGSLESWQDLLGRQRCGVCEGGALGKALKLAELAGELRAKPRQRETAPRIGMGAFLRGRSICKTSGRPGPYGVPYGACAGCEDGQGGIAKGCNGLREW